MRNATGFKSKFIYQMKRAKKSRYLLLMMFFPMLYLYLFQYVPLYGAQIAFRDYNPFVGIWGSPWVGFEHFRTFFSSIYFGRLFKNTLVISLTQLVITFPTPIIVALMINEVRNKHIKKTIQTAISLPHFISVVVVSGIVFTVLDPKYGAINDIITAFGGSPIRFFDEAKYFPFIIAFSELWQGTGYGTVVYLAAISAVDTALYEAAVVDGASRFKQAIYITLPAIVPTIITLFILKIGGLFTVGYQKILLLYNPVIYETADIIQTYVYRRGIMGQEYSFGTAIDLFNSVLNLVMIVTFNQIMKKTSETSLW